MSNFTYRTSLSLYNGVSGLHLAQWTAGLHSERTYYSEIDKFANQVTAARFPHDIPLGDVTRWREWDIDWSKVDVIGAGFPCQSWSMAGQQLGDRDPRGMLFWTTLDIIAHAIKHNPTVKFIMENVKMKSEFEQYITEHTTAALGYVHKICINSTRVSAQNRERYYWTNFKVTQPPDVGTSLCDILETNCIAIPHNLIERIKSGEITADQKLTGESQSAGRAVRNAKNPTDKANTLTACFYKGMQTNSATNVLVGTHFRKLTPTECERLQNMPDGWTLPLSNTQRYKAIGNGWTTGVIVHILKCMYVAGVSDGSIADDE